MNQLLPGIVQQTGTEAIHVPYRGAARSQASGRRSPAFPDVPTMAESGSNGLDLDTWFGAWVPVGNPAEIVNRVGSAFAQVLDDAAVRQWRMGSGDCEGLSNVDRFRSN